MQQPRTENNSLQSSILFPSKKEKQESNNNKNENTAGDGDRDYEGES